MDFIDNDTDAREEQARWILKQPSHGTRTASLMTGGSIQPQYDHDGNEGILYDTNRALIKLIPYRIAKSVVMLGSGRDMVNAASHAISTSADILLICLGSYPRPMMEKVARQAYDNGVIWVCAAGNVVEMVVAPALYPGTIAVAATNPNDLPWSGTSYGEAVDIAAPGEAVYVPFVDEEGREIMAYADGTSYSAPQVAAAAALWKALHAARLRELYPEKWQVAEAFRHCLRASARKPANWTAKMYHMYGAGILDIDGLLKYPLPEPTDPALSYAYREKNAAPRTDLGVRETVHFLWNSLQRKVRPGHQEAMDFVTLTPRGQTALNALVKSQPGGSLEAATGPTAVRSRQILNDYFESFRR
jgi:subtilisin family serine protease